MKRKDYIKTLLLIGICVVIVLLILFRNILKTEGEKEDSKNVVVGEQITRAEAFRLCSYFYSNKQKRESLERILTFTDSKEEDWYDSYINAVVSAGFIQNAGGTVREVRPEEALTCGEFRDLLFAIAEYRNLDYKKIYEKLPERFYQVKEDDELLLEEFLEVYEELWKQIEDKDTSNSDKKNDPSEITINTVKTARKEAAIYLYGLVNSKDGKSGQIIDAAGQTYRFDHLMDYSDLFIETDETQETSKKVQKQFRDPTGLSGFQDKTIEAVICGSELLYVKKTSNATAVVSNAWIISGKKKEVTIYAFGMKRVFKTQYPLAEEIREQIGDFELSAGVIVGITIKPDIISGKVLLASKDTIEVEGYGKVPLDENYRIYKIYGDLQMEKTNSILVGYTITDFIVSDGKICAALIKETIKAENIRVIINKTDYTGLYHDNISLTSDKDFQIAFGEQRRSYKAGEEVTIDATDEMLADGRLKVTTEESGKIILLSVKRTSGNPAYRGTIEAAVSEKGITLINELSLEEYLYAVIPSEMPVSYGAEALKVQAVCARSYAYNQLIANRFGSYGAHVDDSVSCQVYNNIAENEASILSVKDTYGKVISNNGSIITAFYYSTSCGHTASVEDIWESSKPISYLTGHLQTLEKQSVDLSEEEAFRNFILSDKIKTEKKKEETVTTFDSGFIWYRWNVTISKEDMSDQINKNLASSYRTYPDSVLTYSRKAQAEDKKNALEKDDSSSNSIQIGEGERLLDGKVYSSLPIEQIGTVKDIQVVSRGTSGIATELLITGTKNIVLIRYQTLIRTFLAPVKSSLYRADKSAVNKMNLLPSAFVVIDQTEMEDGEDGFLLQGGGYGHGTGMSQNGVKTMTELGKDYEEIIKHYYGGVELKFLYED